MATNRSKSRKSKLTSALTHARRTPYQAIAAIVLSTITFFVVCTFTLLALGGRATLKYLESRPQVTAFFKDEATEVDVNDLRAKIEETGAASSIIYISKEDALKIYQEQNQDNPLLLEMVTADILPASLEVSSKKVEELEKLAAVMQDNDQVEEVVYQKDIVDTLKTWTRGIKIAGVTLSAIFLLASILAIAVIIGLKIATRKEEINTLSLLGATNWYIKGPFVVEAVLYGVVGSFVGWGIVYLILLYLTPNLVNFFQSIPILPVSPLTMLGILGFQMLLGILVGLSASLLATRRYGR